ncbi:hypothetical protein GE09DRAFT_195715 [Coniochaeta sp. 2T2.1]|nr:hypothetical protein GE09DRAFT_195715 [Coniochaeta sp. 2T2.1]
MADTAATGSNSEGVSETTPLLAPNVEQQTTETSLSSTPDAADRTTPVVIATWLELAAAVLCVAFGIACAVLRSESPEGFYFPFMISDVLPAAIFFSVFGGFFAIYNLLQLRRVNRTLPVQLNLLVDSIVAFALIVCAAQAWDYVSIRCSTRYGHELPPDALRRCLAWGQVVMPVLWSFVIFTALVGFTSLFLLIARFILLTQRRSARPSARSSVNWGQFRLPPGQLTFEFTVKLLRQEQHHDTPASLDRSEPTVAS